MTDTLRTILSEPLKAKYRKVKTVPAQVKAAVYGGANPAHCPSITVQFQSDVNVYGLYEALLFVEGYEADGCFAKGTAVAAGKLLK
jgi:hypothetical protein